VYAAPLTYTVATGGAKLAVQRTPKTGNIARYLYNGAGVGVLCQVYNGGTPTPRPAPPGTRCPAAAGSTTRT
jgi:hypothetical protein